MTTTKWEPTIGTNIKQAVRSAKKRARSGPVEMDFNGITVIVTSRTSVRLLTETFNYAVKSGITRIGPCEVDPLFTRLDLGRLFLSIILWFSGAIAMFGYLMDDHFLMYLFVIVCAISDFILWVASRK
jgi:hypothetical protein